jgi:hypothetical protein
VDDESRGPIDFAAVTPTDVPPEENDFPTPDPSRSRRLHSEKAVRKPAPRAKKGQFIEPLTQLYALIGLGVSSVDQVCGPAILASASDCAKALDDLAYTNEAVRRALLSLTTVSGYGQVILAHVPIILAVASHHASGVLPQQLLDTINNSEEPEQEAA